jgi:serine/threonine-protein kinase
MAQRTKVGHYDIVAELGRGGMGVVFKGYEASLHRHVAIKMLSESLADDAMVVERFFREARSMAQLNDPHIVQIYLVGEDQGQPFFAMEFVEGESLSQRLKREHRLEPFEAARILLQVAQGLAAAHDRGVIHRDIKPANLLITQRGVVKVADFGIALATQDFNKKLTGTGQFVGTPGYLSPEVCLGKAVDQRSDLFALGIVFFEMLTGQSPYKDESPLGMMLEVVQAEIPDVRRVNDGIDPRLAEILKRMVAKDPADRYPDCHQLIADLVAAGVNTAMPVTPSRAAPNPIVGTVVNAPTPAEMQRLKTPAPVPVPDYSTVASAQRAMPAPAAPAAALPPPARPALVQSRKSSALPWAAAVVALVAAGGGAAWYFGGSDGDQAAPMALATTTPAADPMRDAEPVTPSPAASSSDGSVASAGPGVSASAGEVVTAVASSTATDAAVPATPDMPRAAATTEAVEPEPVASDAVESVATKSVAVASVADQGSAPGPRASAPESAQSPQSAEIGARLSDLREQRRERREARADSGGGKPQYAKAAPAPSPQAPAYAGPPRVLVLGFGDPAVAASAEMAIEERLAEAGLDLVDEDFVAGLGGIEDGSADMARLVANAGRHAEYVVVVRVVPLGEQLLTFYGEAMTQYTARLDVGAFDLRNKRKLGAGWNTQVSFTHLNADPNTREAIAPYLGRIAQGLGARGRG